MCSDGGLSRSRCSSSVSPDARAHASCEAWLSAVTRSATPARSNALFISAAHACRVSSSHSRGFVRSLFLAPPCAGSLPAGAARRNQSSAARSTPSCTRSENTRCKCGLSAYARVPRQAGVQRERVRHVAPRSRAPRKLRANSSRFAKSRELGSAAVSERNSRPLLRSWLSAAAQYSRASEAANAGIAPDSMCTTSSWQAPGVLSVAADVVELRGSRLPRRARARLHVEMAIHHACSAGRRPSPHVGFAQRNR